MFRSASALAAPSQRACAPGGSQARALLLPGRAHTAAPPTAATAAAATAAAAA